MESEPQNPEFRNNPENFHPYAIKYALLNGNTCNLQLKTIF